MNNPRRGRGRSGRRPNIPTRSQNFDSNGPEGRVRGNAQQVYEKYLAHARDAQAAGDRVLAEAFQQHAEHYYRVMNDSTDPDSRPREQQHQQNQASGSDDERDDEQGDGRGDGRGDGQRGDRRSQERRDGRRDDRGERGNERRAEGRDERGSEERQSNENRPNESRPNENRADERRANGQGHANGSRHAEADEGDGGAAQDDTRSGRGGDAREGRMRERLNRRNGEGILTRRRGGDEEPAGERSNGSVEEEADAGLRKMLGESPRPNEAGEAVEENKASGSEEAAAPAPKPRRRRRTKAEIEADNNKEQSAE